MTDITEIIIPPTASLKTAMEQMTRSHKGVLLVVNERFQLLGVLSDGDARRGILNNVLMSSPVTQIMNTDPITGASTTEGFALLDTNSLSLVPVLDKDRILKGVVIDEDGKKKSFDRQPDKTTKAEAEGILVIIPARGGSKRIPQKNLQKIGGHSLVSRAIMAAQTAFDQCQILVSTDDPQIAEEAARLGVPVPWLRPDILSTDTAGTFEVVEHALSMAIQSGASINAVILLEPTAPLRQPHHLVEAVDLLRSSGSDSVVSVSELPHVVHPEEIVTITADGRLVPFQNDRLMHTRRLRGKQEKVFFQNGIVYAFRPDTILKKKNLYGDKVFPLLIEWKYFADIDEPIDLVTAEAKLKLI